MTNGEKRVLVPPLSDEDTSALKTGDSVLITGTVYTARDAAHKRLIELLEAGKELPIPLKGEIIYYVGPTPAQPGAPIGSAGPTTSGRMDAYAPALMKAGLKGMIGKGSRSAAVRKAITEHGAVYFAATGGAGALLARKVKRAEIVAYEDLGPEAIRRIEVENFPVIVVNDGEGGDLYESGAAAYRRTES
jgi:fumarate hydratase subunit beta